MDKELNKIIKLGEGYHLEFKEAIEKIGTGINRIRNAVKENGKGTVTFSFDSFFTVTFSRIPSSVKTSVKILELMIQNPMISAPEISHILNKTTRAIEMQIAKMKKKGLLKRIGPAKGGHWAVVEDE